MHCTSDYPAAPETVNLLAMDTLRNRLGLPVGYSDHTIGAAVSLAAAARGAYVIEKHFTIDQAAPGPDHAASLSPEQLTDLVAGIRILEEAMGDGVKAPMPNELPTRDLVRRSAFAVRAIAEGEAITDHNVRFLRPAGGIGPELADHLFSARAARPIGAGERLSEADLA
jgi:sialic acid synthase SpsE